MPKETSSPFTPGIPVPVEFFVGRREQIERLRTKLTNAASGRIEVAFLVGERGIGKSSLASFARILFERTQDALCVHTFLGGAGNLEQMVQAIFDRLLKVSVGTSWFDNIKQLFGKHVKQVDLFGINLEFAPTPEDTRHLVHAFAPALRNVIGRVQDEKRVIFLVLDDINGLASRSEFANWLKSLVDEIATSQQPLPLCLLLVGIEERRRELLQLQPSLARVLDVVEIRPWSAAETQDFFRRTFSKVGIAVQQEALDVMVNYACNLPVFAHEIGDAAFNQDTDNVIDSEDALRAVATAAAIIGRKYLEPQIVQALRSARCRSILRKLARDPVAVEFQRSEMMARLSEPERKVFDNFLQRMKRLGVIVPDPERGPGAYRFTRLLHHAYFWMEAKGKTAG